MLPLGKQEMYPRQQLNNQPHNHGANKEKRAERTGKAPPTPVRTPLGAQQIPPKTLTS